MCKYKTIFLFIIAASMITAAFCQENPTNTQTMTVSGTVAVIDTVGSTISILTGGSQPQMSFYVPGNAIITRDTNDIGLMDIKAGDPVTIKYNISSPGKNIADSIIDGKPAAHES